MSEDLLKSLLPALHIAAFERREDGSFTSLAPPPAWFGRLVADPAFPFLGHILEEANVFWRSGGPGLREWGPVAEVDASGAEFHYKVAAVVTERPNRWNNQSAIIDCTTKPPPNASRLNNAARA